MKISGFLKTTLLDWDGKVACTIYLAGCNFRCPYCHNRDLVLNPGEAEDIPLDGIMEYIKRNSDFLDGVVISGGEPTLNKDLPDLIKKLRKLGMDIKIDTNGTMPDVLDDLIGAGMVDFIAMDIKAPLDGRYSSVTDVPVDVSDIRKSIRIIMDSGVDYEFRTTVVPVLIKPEGMEDIFKEIRGAKRYRLHQFRPKNCLDENLTVLDPYPESVLMDMAEKAKAYVKDVRIRGI
ncbi:MAG: anaerobic ribonucleoside-triphosphate reductase activating protein [Candidatus Methanomethylophilaceae archaeon]|nr:anaerobic ribonucleoside-triphosphate reductase activating protein [Candidatus Methanomethylophilaceae archaeon]